MCQQGVDNVFHYLDDFIVLGAPNSQECTMSLATLDRSCAYLGVPVVEHKRDGPTTCLIVLGIEIDTQVGQQLRPPAEKFGCLQVLLATWGDRKTCSRRELEGLLNNACKVVCSGRSFLRRRSTSSIPSPCTPFDPTQSTSIEHSAQIWLGGGCLLPSGMGCPSSHLLGKSQSQSWRRTHRAHGAVGPGTAAGGFKWHGMTRPSHCRSWPRSCCLSSLHARYGGCGWGNKWLWPVSGPAQAGTHTACTCCGPWHL